MAQQTNYPNIGNLQQGNQQIPNMQQYPYGTSNYLMNSPYDNYMGRQMQQNVSNQFLKCRPVSSKQEARAFQIDLDGSLWVFTDVADGKIYTKQINNDGTASFKTYVFTEEKNNYSSSDYVTKEEFNNTIQALVASIHAGNNTNEEVGKDNKNLTF